MYLHRTPPSPSAASVLPSDSPLQHELPRILAEAEATPLPVPPPSCNTGAENSQGIDYVSLTCVADSTPRTLAAFLGLPGEEWEELPRGGHGYSRCRKCGNIRIYYAGGEGMGSYCQISGDGCRELEARGLVVDWQDFAVRALAFKLKGTRLDPYKDDRQGLLDLDELERKCEGRELTTHAQTYGRPSKRVIKLGGKRRTDTLNLGSRRSDSFMRIYDKTLDLRPNGRELDGWRAEHGHHVRVELELKGKRAHAALKALAAQGLAGGLVVGLIRGFVDFKAADASGHNGRRVPAWGPWVEFLGSAATVKLAVEGDLPTLAKAMHYHKLQWAPTLATDFLRLGGDKGAIVDVIMEVVQDGLERRKPKHDALLRRATA